MNQNFRNSTRNDRVSRLSSIFNRQPELLYKNAYINFLREFRIRHLDLELSELYHEAAKAWTKLSDKEKKTFRYLDVIRDIKRRRAIKKKRSKLGKKQRGRRKGLSRIIRRNKRKPYPLTTIKRLKPKRTKIDKIKGSLQKNPPRNSDRVRRILKRLRMINKSRKTGRKRQRRNHLRRRSQRVQRRRQVKRRK